jgi:hypothetical protein
VRAAVVKQRTKSIEQDTEPGNRTRIEQRQLKFRIIGFESRELVEFPHLMSDHDAEIPERVQERTQELLLRRPDATTEQDQQVDIRMQTQMPPAITAEREHHELVRRAACVGKQLPQHGVDTIGVPFEGRPPPRAAQDVGLKL